MRKFQIVLAALLIFDTIAQIQAADAQILFDREDGIYVLDTNGSHRRISEVGHDPRFSPDGRRFLYHRSGIYIVNSDGSDLVQISSRGWGSRWSPDATSVVFYTDSINVVNLTTLEIRPIAEGTNPAWSPDGNTILFQARDFSDVCAIDPNGHNKRKLASTGGANLSNWTNPISPNSDQFLVIYGDDGLFDLQIGSMAGGELTTIGPGGDNPSWSPDGSRIVYVIRPAYGVPTEDTGLYVTDPSGNDVNRILVGNDNWVLDYPSWSPSGEEILFDTYTITGRESRRDIYLVKSDGSNLRKLLEGFSPMWGPHPVNFHPVFGSEGSSFIKYGSWGQIKANW